MALADQIVCISPVSKNLRGAFSLTDAEPEECDKLDCQTLETTNSFKFSVAGFPCDSQLGALLDGVLFGSMVHKFADGDGRRRGVHEATLRWRGRNRTLVAGTMRGVTNAGTHRTPVFDPCQECDEPGVMEGLLTGRVVRTDHESLVGCRVQACYRIRFEPSEKGPQAEASATLEGALICACPS